MPLKGISRMTGKDADWLHKGSCQCPGKAAIPVIGIGGSLFDTFFMVDRFPDEDSKIRATETWSQCGGPVATAMAAVSHLGTPSAFAGSMGSDPPGQAMIDDFKFYGVATEGIKIRSGCQSASSMILVNKERATRTIIWNPGDAASLHPDELPRSLLDQARVLHVDGLQTEAAQAAARHFRSAGKIVSMDAGSFHPGYEQLLALTDWLICAESFVLRQTGAANAEEAVRKIFRQYHPVVAAATQGSSGGIWTVDGSSVFRYQPFPVSAVDTTGAGDVFHGAVLYARLLGWDWPRVFTFASAAAALKCTRPGGRAGMPTRTEVDAFLHAQQGAGL